jgi:GDP-D-mannose 3',5'-epimerase
MCCPRRAPLLLPLFVRARRLLARYVPAAAPLTRPSRPSPRPSPPPGIEGVLRITKSDFREPLNLGSTEMVPMNEMMNIVMNVEGKKLPIKHIPGPEGVRGRNSDNELILEKLGWQPTVTLKDGLRLTYKWIKGQIEKEQRERGVDTANYASSMICKTSAPTELGSLRKADGEEGLVSKVAVA